MVPADLANHSGFYQVLLLTPKMGISDAAAQGVNLLNRVSRRRLAPEFAFESLLSAASS